MPYHPLVLVVYTVQWWASVDDAKMTGYNFELTVCGAWIGVQHSVRRARHPTYLPPYLPTYLRSYEFGAIYLTDGLGREEEGMKEGRKEGRGGTGPRPF